MSNTTALMSPSDLVMVVPRLIARAGSFAFITVPERIDSMFGIRHGGSMIAEATGNGTWNMISAALSKNPIASTPVPRTAVAQTPGSDTVGPFNLASFGQVRNFSGIFTYMTSRWALACCALSIILNRTTVYSAARRHITLSWPVRFALRIIPLLLFTFHAVDLLRTIRCQTSPRFSLFKYGKADKHLELDFSGDGGLLYWLSSIALFWENDADSCLAMDMIPSRSEAWDRKGSLGLLWPLFQSLCLGQFVETISATIQGRPIMTENGMNVFEHSLAFAEAEAIVSSRLGLGLLGSGSSRSTSIPAGESAMKLLSKRDILNMMNTPPEVLLMALISCLNNLTSQVLGILDLQARFRLINTGIWGVCFMGTFIWGFLSFRPEPTAEGGSDFILMRFPTVCIVGFIPHLLILVGILFCAAVYTLALALCFVSPPPDGASARTFRDRLTAARENMQVNVQLPSVRLNMAEDFYAALMRVGFNALTIASEAVYLNEGQQVRVASSTWLEESRLKDFVLFSQLDDQSRRLDLQWQEVNHGIESNERGLRSWKSGYDRQIDPKYTKLGLRDTRMQADGGVGQVQRVGRYAMAGTFLYGVFKLSVRWLLVLFSALLTLFGFARRFGSWHLSKRKNATSKKTNRGGDSTLEPSGLEFWMMNAKGEVEAPQSLDYDVEAELRRRIEINEDEWVGTKEEDKERALDMNTYEWWLKNGRWGVIDGSGSYQASIQDDDATSAISVTTNASSVSHSEVEDDTGTRTPTQRLPHPSTRPLLSTTLLRTQSQHHPSYTLPGHETNPSYIVEPHPLDLAHLASLLDAKTPEKRDEARMLVHHMKSPTVTTRSKYRHAQAFESSRLLTSTRYRPPNSQIPASGPLSLDEEAQLLEQIILANRAKPLPAGFGTGSWRDGAAGMGQNGPQCVVCQSAPRTILAWPCRCLSLCEECRVNLAMNNFGTCVCCRRDVVGFSKLFVP
ncbi:hypothetical protein MMC21_003515 [Puttea exsequens]|nr:hypothetical protein [Puttea exsequens]